MRCNINAKGKAIRMLGGLVAVFLAVVLTGLVWAGVLDGGWWWLVVVGTVLSGAFMVFESRSGWCIVRAMGFRTPF